MLEKNTEYQKHFNKLLKSTLSVLELSKNEDLKNSVRCLLYDFSDIIKPLLKENKKNDREEKNPQYKKQDN